MKLKLATTHSNGLIITYSAKVLKITEKEKTILVEIPERVRTLPFPPYKGKRYVIFDYNQVKNQII